MNKIILKKIDVSSKPKKESITACHLNIVEKILCI